ncbi:helix-turn-helix domain-containing protein [Acerihabitans arboris]|uniref:Helix-turn-helix domain-containing protein n=1 Tax=Acerihabitans arboris TaxID=2691583 RepID=A0A845SEV1_9GAMM|nr:AraC family transcriptional regulator [Acerihabitans arboris]NDL61616.1 helix-turn-helix domain-containing protein [Acerihabitans arboris]
MTTRNAFIERLIVWMQDNMDKPFSIQDLAQRAGYSKWYLQKLFYQATHITLGDYLRDKKLEMAAKKLKYSKESMITIAITSGYTSQPAFIRAFKKKYKVTPSRYRRDSLCNFEPM